MSTTDYDPTLWLEGQILADDQLAGAGRCECAPAGVPCRMQPYCAHRVLVEVAVKRTAIVAYRAAEQLATGAGRAERMVWHATYMVLREYLQVLGTVYSGRPGYDTWRAQFGWPTQSAIPAEVWESLRTAPPADGPAAGGEA